MQTFFRGAIWSVIWIATMAITAWLCTELATKQPVVLALILLAAFVASVGPVYARQTWQAGNKGTAIAAIWVSVLAVCVAMYSEASFWSSSIEGMHEEVSREQAIREGHDIVLSKRKERLSNLAVGKTPEQLKAEISAAQVDHLWQRTAACTDATVQESRDFCKNYHQLEADLAASKQAHSLEGELWAIGTSQEDAGLRRDFYRAAVMASEHLGGSVQSWIAGIVIVLVLLLESLRDLSLFIAFAPSKKQRGSRPAIATATEAKAPSAPNPRGGTKQPVLGEQWAEKRAAFGDRSEKPVELPKPHTPSVVVDNTSKVTQKHSLMGSVKVWKDLHLARSKLGGFMTGAAYEDSYHPWCVSNGYTPYHKNVFGKKLTKCGVRGGKRKDGAWRPGWNVLKAEVAKIRAAA